MKRYVYSSKQYDFPEFITYQYNDRLTYKFKQKYLHEGGPLAHEKMEGMYYEVCEENGKSIKPHEAYIQVIADFVDVYSDGYVGYVWGGRIHPLGHLDGTEIVSGD